jgi:abhydrolase domain-containing protein 17
MMIININWQRLLLGEFSLRRVISSVLFIYVCLTIYAYFLTDGIIFLPRPSSYGNVRELVGFKEQGLMLNSSNGNQIAAVYLPKPGANYTILHSHGNAEDLGDVLFILRKMQGLGFSVFAYDYQGYGQSSGTPSETNAYADINAAYSYLTQNLQIPAQQILVYGRSIGSGPSVDLASRQPVGGLILESPFLSISRFLASFNVFPFDKFPNLAKIKQVKSPVLIMHGRKDQVIPFAQGEELYNAANPPKQNLWIDTAGHNDFIDEAGEKYDRAMQEFQILVSQHRASS